MTKHTPGPWEMGARVNSSSGITISGNREDGKEADFNKIASAFLFYGSSSLDRGTDTIRHPANAESLANATLIQSAPKLLETLQNISMMTTTTEYFRPEQILDGIKSLADTMIKEADGGT